MHIFKFLKLASTRDFGPYHMCTNAHAVVSRGVIKLGIIWFTVEKQKAKRLVTFFIYLLKRKILVSFYVFS